MRNPFLQRRDRSGVQAHGRRSERQTAKRLDAKLTPASGALDGAKGDMSLGDYKLEAKCTDKKSLGVKYEWLVKISDEALTMGKSPAVTVTFVTGDGRPRRFGRWVMVPEDDFNAYMEE